MSEDGKGTGEHLAVWLKEAGHRTRHQPAPADDSDDTYNSPAALHRYVEELAGKPLRTHAEVLGYLGEVAGTNPLQYRDQERRRMVREVALLALLTLSYLHYYYWEVQVEIAKLNSVRIFIPAGPGGDKKV